MATRHVGEFLDKFKTKESPSAASARAQELIEARVKIKFPPKSCSIRNGVVYLSVPPAAKSAIFTRKEEILTEIKKTLPRIKDIR